MDIKTFNRLPGKSQFSRLPFKVIAIAAFGSRVTKHFTENSDLDLLVVASGIAEKRHRRGEQIVLLKKLLPLLPIDIMLLSKEETLSNFKNHNPLFLDIASEGIIIFDSHDFLADLIKKTREYIETNKIRKIEDGWVFPVTKGVPTFL